MSRSRSRRRRRQPERVAGSSSFWRIVRSFLSYRHLLGHRCTVWRVQGLGSGFYRMAVSIAYLSPASAAVLRSRHVQRIVQLTVRREFRSGRHTSNMLFALRSRVGPVIHSLFLRREIFEAKTTTQLNMLTPLDALAGLLVGSGLLHYTLQLPQPKVYLRSERHALVGVPHDSSGGTRGALQATSRRYWGHSEFWEPSAGRLLRVRGGTGGHVLSWCTSTWFT